MVGLYGGCFTRALLFGSYPRFMPVCESIPPSKQISGRNLSISTQYCFGKLWSIAAFEIWLDFISTLRIWPFPSNFRLWVHSKTCSHYCIADMPFTLWRQSLSYDGDYMCCSPTLTKDMDGLCCRKEDERGLCFVGRYKAEECCT